MNEWHTSPFKFLFLVKPTLFAFVAAWWNFEILLGTYYNFKKYRACHDLSRL